MADRPDQQAGTLATSDDFARYDQVDKPTYHLSEAADEVDAFDDDFTFTTCDLGRFLHGDDGDRAAFSQELGDAMSVVANDVIIEDTANIQADSGVVCLFLRS